MTKLDVLDGLDEIKIGAKYLLDGREVVTPPGNTNDLNRMQVEYVTMPGWKQSIAGCRRFEELPQAAQNYVRKVEELCEVPSKCADKNVVIFQRLIWSFPLLPSQVDWRRPVA